MGICHIVRCKAALPEYKQEANNMATIEKTVESVGMKITVNYGEKDGKIQGTWRKMDDLVHTQKLLAAGYKEV